MPTGCQYNCKKKKLTAYFSSVVHMQYFCSSGDFHGLPVTLQFLNVVSSTLYVAARQATKINTSILNNAVC